MASREAHVKRIYSDDMASYVDVYRLSMVELSGSVINGVSGQAETQILDWTDDDKEQGREYEDITLNPPDGISGSPIKIKVIKSISFLNSGQKSTWSFDNDTQNNVRKTKPVRVICKEPEETFDGVKSWDDYKSFIASATPDETQYIDTYIVDGINHDTSGQVSILTLDEKDVEDFIGGGSPSSNAVMLDPFQTIVNVKWSDPVALAVEFFVDWWGPEASSVYCFPDDFTEYYDAHSSDADWVYASWFGYGFFATTRRLRASSSYSSAGYPADGVLQIGGTKPGDVYSYSGVPSIDGDIASGALTDLCLNLDTWYGRYAEWGQFSHVEKTGMLSVDYVLRAPNTIYGGWCDNGGSYYWAPGNREIMVDGRGFDRSDTTHSREMCRKSLDFSGLTVTRLHDGKVFRAKEVGWIGDTEGHIFIEMEPIPTH